MPRYVSCNLCGLNDTEIVQKAEEPFKVVKCKKCGLVYTNPQPDSELIQQHYQEDYYKEWLERQMKRRIPMWKKRLKGLKKYKKKGRLLDVGFGSGTFLGLAKEEGFEIYGTEISEFACRYVKDRLGIDVFRGDLREAHFPDDTFDVITIWHTLEHLPDPKATLKEIHRLLKKDGLLVVAVPNLNNYITRILYLLAKGKKLKLFSINAKELHFWHFSNHSITSMLKKAGFEIIKIDMDLAQIELQKKIVDYLTILTRIFTGRNFGEALKIFAVKT